MLLSIRHLEASRVLIPQRKGGGEGNINPVFIHSKVSPSELNEAHSPVTVQKIRHYYSLGNRKVEI